MLKHVHFDSSKDSIVHYDASDDCNVEQVHESCKRSCRERSVLDQPKTQLDKMYKLVDSWRKQPISIVFGNLGRQPHLLQYYLDMCFGSEEEIKIFCKWNPSQRKRSKNTDFLIHIEPYFGCTVYKDPSVKHLVILTSHLNLNCWGRIKFDYLQLSNSAIAQPSLNEPKHCDPFKPPIFHTDPVQMESEEILLDVSESKSACEAYLRLLTGREIIRNRPFKMRFYGDDRDKIRTTLAITRANWFKWFNGDNYPKECYPCSYLGII